MNSTSLQSAPKSWRVMSVPGVGRITALAYMAAIEKVDRFRRTRDIGAYLDLTGRRYQTAETDVGMGIFKRTIFTRSPMCF
jgi:transposase